MSMFSALQRDLEKPIPLDPIAQVIREEIFF